MLITFNREKSCLEHGKAWGEFPALLHYSLPCVHNVNYFQCSVYQVIRFEEIRIAKIKDGALGKKMLALYRIILNPSAYDTAEPLQCIIH